MILGFLRKTCFQLCPPEEGSSKATQEDPISPSSRTHTPRLSLSKPHNSSHLSRSPNRRPHLAQTCPRIRSVYYVNVEPHEWRFLIASSKLRVSEGPLFHPHKPAQWTKVAYLQYRAKESVAYGDGEFGVCGKREGEDMKCEEALGFEFGFPYAVTVSLFYGTSGIS